MNLYATNDIELVREEILNFNPDTRIVIVVNRYAALVSKSTIEDLEYNFIYYDERKPEKFRNIPNIVEEGGENTVYIGNELYVELDKIVVIPPHAFFNGDIKFKKRRKLWREPKENQLCIPFYTKKGKTLWEVSK